MSDEMTSTGSMSGQYVAVAPQKPDVLESGLGSSRYKEYDYPGYAQVVRVRIPAALWSAVYYSWLSLKGHLQGLHDWDRTEFFVGSTSNGDVEAVFSVVWMGAEALEDYIESGFGVDEMLRQTGISSDNVEVQLMRDFS